MFRLKKRITRLQCVRCTSSIANTSHRFEDTVSDRDPRTSELCSEVLTVYMPSLRVCSKSDVGLCHGACHTERDSARRQDPVWTQFKLLCRCVCYLLVALSHAALYASASIHVERTDVLFYSMTSSFVHDASLVLYQFSFLFSLFAPSSFFHFLQSLRQVVCTVT